MIIEANQTDDDGVHEVSKVLQDALDSFKWLLLCHTQQQGILDDDHDDQDDEVLWSCSFDLQDQMRIYSDIYGERHTNN
jgi:hypothetical protein